MHEAIQTPVFNGATIYQEITAANLIILRLNIECTFALLDSMRYRTTRIVFSQLLLPKSD